MLTVRYVGIYVFILWSITKYLPFLQGKSAARGGASEWKDVGVYMDLLNTEDGEATRHVFIFNLPKEIDPRLELLLEGREEVEAYGPWKGGWSHEP